MNRMNKTKYLSTEELDYLVNMLERNSSRDSLMIRLALALGPRASELLAITKRDLDHTRQTVFIRGLKGSNDRELPLRTKLYKELEIYSKSVIGDKIFNIGYDRLYKIWCYYRPANKGFHCLRHTFAIQLYKKTKDIRLLQVALGHRSISNTSIYAEYLYAQEELRKLIL